MIPTQAPASSAARAGGRTQARAQAATPRGYQLHLNLSGGRARASTAPSPTLGGGKPRAAQRASTARGRHERHVRQQLSERGRAKTLLWQRMLRATSRHWMIPRHTAIELRLWLQVANAPHLIEILGDDAAVA